MSCLSLVIQSPVKDPLYIDERIDIFLASFKEKLEAMPDEEFQSNINALILLKTQTRQRLTLEVRDHWEEIQNWSFQFDRSKMS